MCTAWPDFLIGARLVSLARRVYPRLATSALVYEVGTPRTYERFTQRPLGAVGGVRQTIGNANQRAVPHDIGVPGFWLAGDTTWPGLGTVACVVGSRIVAESVSRTARKAKAHMAVDLQPDSLNDNGCRHGPQSGPYVGFVGT